MAYQTEQLTLMWVHDEQQVETVQFVCDDPGTLDLLGFQLAAAEPKPDMIEIFPVD